MDLVHQVEQVDLEQLILYQVLQSIMQQVVVEVQLLP